MLAPGFIFAYLLGEARDEVAEGYEYARLIAVIHCLCGHLANARD